MTAHWSDELVKMSACPKPVEWAHGFDSLQAAWDACERADWMLWYLVHRYPATCGPVRLAMCACAETALQYVPKGEDRPRIAIETARRYVRGLATDAELVAARDAAWVAAGDAARAAAWAAARDDAGDAAWAAAQAAARDAAGDAAWAAARDDARDAAGDAAWAAALAQMSDLIRREVPDPAALERIPE